MSENLKETAVRVIEQDFSCESNKALVLLGSPNLFDFLTEKILNDFVVGELAARKAIFLCSCGRLVANSQIASFNILITSASGSGKDFLATKTLLLWGKEIVQKRTRISPNVLNYWHNPKFEPDWTWDGKILYLQDVSNQILNADSFKVMCSDGSHVCVLVNQVPQDIEIRGKPVIVLTSANASPSIEMLRRFPTLSLTETVKQTEDILAAQAEAAVSGTVEAGLGELDFIQKTLGSLRRVKVLIPFASLLPPWFRGSPIIARTHFSRFLDFIRASAALHQHQRERKEGAVFAAEQDYTVARAVFLTLTGNKQLAPVSASQRKVLAVLSSEWVPFSDIEARVNFCARTRLYELLNELTESGLVLKEARKVEGKDKPIFWYALASVEKLFLPSFEGLKNCEKSGFSGNGENGENSGNSGNTSLVSDIEGVNPLIPPNPEGGKSAFLTDFKDAPVYGTVEFWQEKVQLFLEKQPDKAATEDELLNELRAKGCKLPLKTVGGLITHLKARSVLYERRAGVLALV